MTLEVDYQMGAEPYDSYPVRVGSPWELLSDNLEALFAMSSPRDLVVPQTLSEMTEIPASSQTDYDAQDLLDLAELHRSVPSTDSDRSFYVVFVDGYFERDGERQAQVLGVSLGDTGVVAIFKPVIGDGLVAPFVEQTTLIHEVGHAVGLVNNGLELSAAHHDSEHGAHCTNEDCVMYYLNEGAGDAVQFAQERLMGGDTVVFDDDCLADAHAAALD